jgi:hypothetical protein
MKTIGTLISATILMTSCTSTTLIQSTPPGADVYFDSQKKGTSPYSYSDTKIMGSSTNITLKKDGYQDLNVTLTPNERADVGAIIGGCFVLVPFLWTMKYDPIYTYELQQGSSQYLGKNSNQSSNSTNELVKLKNLLDESAITSDDYTTLKVKILNDEYDYKNSIADQIIKLKGLLDSKLLRGRSDKHLFSAS